MSDPSKQPDHDPRHIAITKSDWLRNAKTTLLLRDPVDALNDAEALVAFCRQRLDALSKK
ncbi:hypothetical protein [uncultured Roseobacter sp.]|uniref:hypothetical protein n=1 Tax=uncultured Roseobacter sp. TaxID=114847 RepID=UPI00261E2EF3|nr:hypothetical protein [uncultured Roseobacter sp.]